MNEVCKMYRETGERTVVRRGPDTVDRKYSRAIRKTGAVSCENRTRDRRQNIQHNKQEDRSS